MPNGPDVCDSARDSRNLDGTCRQSEGKWQDVRMEPKVTLLVSTQFSASAMTRLIESIDSQSLAPAEFRTIFVGPESSSQDARLVRYSTFRRNVVVCSGNLEAAEHLTNRGYVIHLSPDLQGQEVRLLPDALERLHSFADAAGADAVVGRHIGHPTRELPGLTTAHEGATVSDALREAAVSAPCALIRRSLADGQRVVAGLSVEGRRSLIEAAPTIVAFSSEACLIVPRPETGKTSTSGDCAVRITSATASWREGKLNLEVTATATANPPVDLTNSLLRFSLRHAAAADSFHRPSLRDYQYEANGQVTKGADTNFSITASGVVDLLTPATGEPLEPGVWEVRMGVLPQGTQPATWSRLPSDSVATALKGNRLVRTAPTKRGLVLDIGAVRYSGISALDQSSCEIVETAQGSLLRMTLADVHAEEDGAVHGSLLLDRLRLPAQLIAKDGRVFIECFVSGLAGSSPIATAFGLSRPHPTGLALTISETGVMTVGRQRPTASQPRQRQGQPVDRPAKVAPDTTGQTQPAAESNVPSASSSYVASKLRQSPPEVVRGAVARLWSKSPWCSAPTHKSR